MNIYTITEMAYNTESGVSRVVKVKEIGIVDISAANGNVTVNYSVVDTDDQGNRTNKNVQNIYPQISTDPSPNSIADKIISTRDWEKPGVIVNPV